MSNTDLSASSISEEKFSSNNPNLSQNGFKTKQTSPHSNNSCSASSEDEESDIYLVTPDPGMKNLT